MFCSCLQTFWFICKETIKTPAVTETVVLQSHINCSTHDSTFQLIAALLHQQCCAWPAGASSKWCCCGTCTSWHHTACKAIVTVSAVHIYCESDLKSRPAVLQPCKLKKTACLQLCVAPAIHWFRIHQRTVDVLWCAGFLRNKLTWLLREVVSLTAHQHFSEEIHC